MARQEVLKGENGIVDYGIEEEISFYMGLERQFVPLHKNLKFSKLLIKRTVDWRIVHNQSWLLNRLQEELGVFGLSDKEIFQINSVLVDFAVRYQYRD